MKERTHGHAETVPPSEFTRYFGRYRIARIASRSPSRFNGQITRYFVGQDEYEEFKLFPKSRSCGRGPDDCRQVAPLGAHADTLSLSSTPTCGLPRSRYRVT